MVRYKILDESTIIEYIDVKFYYSYESGPRYVYLGYIPVDIKVDFNG